MMQDSILYIYIYIYIYNVLDKLIRIIIIYRGKYILINNIVIHIIYIYIKQSQIISILNYYIIVYYYKLFFVLLNIMNM